MRVIKRNGTSENVSFDKVLIRITKLSEMNPKLNLDPSILAQQVCGRIYDNITTTELDEFASSLSASMSFENLDYEILASRLIISNHHKNTSPNFLETSKKMESFLDNKYYSFVESNIDFIQETIDYSRDYLFDYFGFKTLEKGRYLYKCHKENKTIERPQHMIMRICIGIHLNDIQQGDSNVLESIKETYDLISTKKYTHATPTLFNAGTKRPQLSSCFLLDMQNDSIEGIYDTLKDCALISKEAGGIGIAIHKVRSKNSEIKGTNGISNGLVPMLKVFNETAKYVDQGGGKRKGSFSIYLEPWHADIQEFLDLKKSRGSDELRARDLFYALWIPDLFMKRVKEEQMWSLFSPSKCPGLNEKFGKEFEELYVSYEKQFPDSVKIPAQDLWRQILSNCVETGGPSILFKDHCNRKSNHQHLGTIQSSNLCTEIIQFSNAEETAVCNLASICLPSFIKCAENQQKYFDYNELKKVVHKIVENLNRVIDVNYYPTEKCLRSNKRHRPIGIGVQGMADMYQELDISWEDPVAMKINKNIFEVIYFSALEKSNQLAQKYGTYETYEGSPMSKGILQFHYTPDIKPSGVNGVCDWNQLLEDIKKYGCRNSLLVAPMPTASTSQIMGFSECFEPQTSNIFIRRTNAGEFKMLNKRLIKKLTKLNLWTSEIKNKILLYDGSIQWMDETIHPDIQRMKQVYKTIWEIKHRLMIDFACERGAFIDQSQSFNVYMEDPSINKLNSAYFYSWDKGLKTCQYYLRIRTKAKAIQFTVDPSLIYQVNNNTNSSSKDYCSRDNPNCASCSS
jgi:ribonucleoside-diphosphate reductase alpha subunit